MKSKLSRFREELKKREISSAIITDEINIHYLCGYNYTDGFLLIGEENAYLVTDGRYEEEAVLLADKSFDVVVPDDRMAFVRSFLKDVRNLGYEGNSMTVETFHRYETALVTPMVPLGDLLAQMRAVKTEEEIGYIKKAQNIADAAYSHILKVLTPTVTEKEIALELSYFMRRNGAEGDSFDIIAVSGAASALPHGKCRNERISKGFLTMDFGCRYHGYCSDMTRTVCIGKADEEMRRVYQTVLAAQREALFVIRAGETGAFVDGVARQYIAANGYGDAFSHSLGHGVGLYIHELPTLSSRSNVSLLVPGNVVTVEPGIYLAGKYGCRIEDMGVVTADGFDNFTKSNKELIELFA